MKYLKALPGVGRQFFITSSNRLEIAKNWLYLKTIPKSQQTLIVGPWLSEVGFEVLYWIPFLTWLIENLKFNNRIIVVSRGGTKMWYGKTADSYADILDFYSPDEFRERNEERVKQTKLQKQMSVTDFDREIIRKVKKKYQLGKTRLIHPSIMYRLFGSYWYNQSDIGLINNYARFQPYNRNCPKLAELPDNYIALKFYFSDCFPRTTENVKFINKLVERLSQNNNLVVLNANLNIDDHTEPVYQSPKIFTLGQQMKPQNNLSVQTRAIAHAKAFFGTYGGFSYLAPFYGVPSYSFYSNSNGFNRLHLDAANNAYRQISQQTGKETNFNVLPVSDLDSLANILKEI